MSGNDIVVDAGADTGIFTSIASQMADHVIAIELNPQNCKILRENVEGNGIENVTLIEKALYSSLKVYRSAPRISSHRLYGIIVGIFAIYSFPVAPLRAFNNSLPIVIGWAA